jgi:hypothetical protein
MPHLIQWVLLALLLGGCSTLRVETDYDPERDYTVLHTFAIVHSDRPGDDTLTSNRIRKALLRHLEGKGWRAMAQEKADVLVRYRIGTRLKTESDTEYRYEGYYAYRYGYVPLMIPQTTVSTYEERMFIVDIVQPGNHALIWRGRAVDRMQRFDTPEDRSAYIDRTIGILLERFPPDRSTP